MGLFSWLRGVRAGGKGASTRPAARAEGSPARAAAAAYDPGLIAKLKSDHGELQRTVAAVQRAAAEGRFHDIQRLLAHFKQLLQAHIATENARLYPYLQRAVAHDPEPGSRLAGTRRDVNGLTFEVLKVVDAYLAYPPTHLSEAQFTYDLAQAAAQLAKRVEQAEAQLYSLYRS